jgi:hypothetical protein
MWAGIQGSNFAAFIIKEVSIAFVRHLEKIILSFVCISHWQAIR